MCNQSPPPPDLIIIASFVSGNAFASLLDRVIDVMVQSIEILPQQTDLHIASADVLQAASRLWKVSSDTTVLRETILSSSSSLARLVSVIVDSSDAAPVSRLQPCAITALVHSLLLLSETTGSDALLSAVMLL